MQPQSVTPSLLRQFFAGGLDMNALPAMLRGQLQAVAARLARQQARVQKRQRVALVHMRDDGERAMARRRRQIAAGSLRVENGLAAQ